MTVCINDFTASSSTQTSRDTKIKPGGHCRSNFISQRKGAVSTGDVITTGTPPGVGLGMNSPVFLKAGDVVELGIDGLGAQRQIVKAFGA